MKYMKHLKFLIIVVVAAAFCSCQKDDVNKQNSTPDAEEAITFNISIDPPFGSRLNVDDLSLVKTSFEKGDEIGIWVVKRPINQVEPQPPAIGQAADGSDIIRLMNYILKMDDEGKWGFNHPNEANKNLQLLSQPGYRFDYYAYYPPVTGGWDGKLNNGINPTHLTYAPDNTGKSMLKQGDLMAAVNTDCPYGTTVVNLNFKHLLAMLEVRQPGLGRNATVKLKSPAISSLGYLDFSLPIDDPNFFTTYTPEQLIGLDQNDGGRVPPTSLNFMPIKKDRNTEEYKDDGRFFLWLPPQNLPGDGETYIEICSDPSNNPEENTVTIPLEVTNGDKVEFVQGESRIIQSEVKWTKELLNTPNSVIHTNKLGGGKTLPVAKVYAMWMEDPVLKATNPYLYGPLRLKRLWSDREDFDDAYDVKLLNPESGASARLQISPKAGQGQLVYEGNAVYGLYIGDTLRWSWHIWGTTRVNPQEGGKQLNGKTFMAYNLGAWPNSTGEAGGGIRGLLYQYGRKDPFPGASNDGWDFTKYQAVYDTSGLINAELPYGVPILSSARTSNVDSLTINPMAFHTAWNPTGTNLWNTAADGKKSPYDPCPLGWRVGVDPTQSVWYKDGSSALSNYTTSEWDNGVSFNASGYDLGYYPQTNHRTATGAFSVQSAISMWHGGTNGNSFTVQGQSVNTNATSDKALGQHVRCVKDDTDTEIWNTFTNPDFVIWESFGGKLKGKVKK